MLGKALCFWAINLYQNHKTYSMPARQCLREGSLRGDAERRLPSEKEFNEHALMWERSPHPPHQGGYAPPWIPCGTAVRHKWIL